MPSSRPDQYLNGTGYLFYLILPNIIVSRRPLKLITLNPDHDILVFVLDFFGY
ncbi:hypothetical protein BDZ94DRAFT_1271581 [Collybia nuda]|uniref:Uncharacterized protein n=1 Tax=Collybia nuda TaxID=64659 RepID=A0A9P5XWI8_9AGAR|nr:hypothetical protein BDZ94DRAFT_1271581 [Collybia nuda]